MAYYEELVEGWQLSFTASGVTGTRKFKEITRSSSITSLPTIGSLWEPSPSEVSSKSAAYAKENFASTLVAISIVEEKFGGVTAYSIYTITYENTAEAGTGSGSEETEVEPTLLPTSGSINAESLSIEGKGAGYTWKLSGDEVDQQIFKKMITGSFKTTKRVSKLLSVTWAEYSGCVNSTNFVCAGGSYPKGTILFNGISFDDYYRNNKGRRRWKVDFNFGVKLVPAVGGGYTGWNHILREKDGTGAGEFLEVLDKAKTAGLYVEKDLNLLLKK